MEIDKTVRTFGKCLRSIEKCFGCSLKELDGKTSASRSLIKRVCIESKLNELFEKKRSECDWRRDIHTLLFCNCEFEFKDELESCSHVGHLIGVIPALNAAVYFALCQAYDLLDYALELLERAPIRVASEILFTVNAQLHQLPIARRFFVASDALYALFRRFRTDTAIPKVLYDGFNSLLLSYKEEDVQDADDNENDKLKGYKWMSLLRLLKAVTRIRFEDDEGEIRGSPTRLAINFRLRFEAEADTDRSQRTADCAEKVVRECYEKIFYLCVSLGCALDVNVFVEWHEIDFDERSTLQNAVGEEAYRLRDCLERHERAIIAATASSLPPADVQLLLAIVRSVQVRPPSPSPLSIIDESVAEAITLAELERRLSEDDYVIDANFLNRLVTFLLNESDDRAFEFEIYKKLVRRLCDERTLRANDPLLVKDVILRLLRRRTNVDELACFVGEFIQKYGTDHILYEEFSSSDARTIVSRIDQVFKNDGQDSDQAFKDLLLGVLCSTNEVLRILVKEACTENGCAANILEILLKLRTACLSQPSSSFSTIHLPLLVAVLNNFLKVQFAGLSPAEKLGFFDLVILTIDTIANLNANQLVDVNILYEECLLPFLNLKVVENDTEWDTIADLVMLLKNLFSNFNIAPKSDAGLRTLICLANILEKARWRISTFTMARLRTCEVTIETVQLLRKKFLLETDNEEYEKVEKELRSYSALTKGHFIEPFSYGSVEETESQIINLIWKPVANPASFVNELIEKKAFFVLHLGKILPLCTHQELENIIQNFTNGETTQLLIFLDMMTNGVSFIFNCASQFSTVEVDTNQIYLCLGHMINNLFILLMKYIDNVNESKEMDRLLNYVNRICANLKYFPTDLIRTYEFNVIKFIVDMLEKFKNNDLRAEQTDDETGRYNLNLAIDSRKLLVGLFLL